MQKKICIKSVSVLTPFSLTCKVSSEGVIRLRVVDEAHQGLDDLLSLGGGLPVLRRHDGKTHLALLINVGVVDLGPKENLWWHHWVFLWQEKLEVEHTSLKWGVAWTSNLHIEVSAVGLRWLSVDAHN